MAGSILRERQGGHRTDAPNLPHPSGFRKRRFDHGLQLLVVPRDLLVERADHRVVPPVAAWSATGTSISR